MPVSLTTQSRKLLISVRVNGELMGTTTTRRGVNVIVKRRKLKHWYLTVKCPRCHFPDAKASFVNVGEDGVDDTRIKIMPHPLGEAQCERNCFYGSDTNRQDW